MSDIEYCVLWTMDGKKIVSKCDFIYRLENKLDRIKKVCKHSKSHHEKCNCTHCEIRNIVDG